MREVEREDLEDMKKWLEGHGENVVPIGLLPPTGLIVEDIAMGFLYLTNSSAAWIENVVSNPIAAPTDVAKAIDEIVEGLIETAKGYGVIQIFALTKKNSIYKWGQHLGFEGNDEDYTIMARRL